MTQQTVIGQIRALAADRCGFLRATMADVLSQREALDKGIGKGPWKRIYVTGCGTSYFAAMVFKHVFEELTGMATEGIQSFDLLGYQTPGLLGPDALVVGYSTAGDTEAVVRALEKARKAGAATVAVTAVAEGPAARTCDAVLLTGATDEVSVPRTKGQMQGLLTLYLLGICLGRSSGHLTEAAYQDQLRQLEAAIDAIGRVIASEEPRMEVLPRTYKGCGSVFVVGCGPNLGTAHTGALMITEMAKVHALGDGMENFLHGRDREFDPKDPVFILAPRGPCSARTLDFLTVTAHVHAPTVVFTDAADRNVERLATHVLALPGGFGELYTPLVYLAPLLLFAHHLAAARGEDSNKRRYTDIVPTKVRFQGATA